MHLFIFRLLFIFACLSRVDSAIDEFCLDHDINLMANATKQIIQQVYSQRSSIISLIRLAMQPLTYYKQSEIINRVLLTCKSTVAYMIEQPKYMKLSPYLRFNGIIFLDGYEAFRDFHKETSINTVHYGGYFTIILTEYVDEQEITKMFTDCWERHMINVNVLRLNELGDQVNIYTYFPFETSNCGRVEATLLMTLNETTSLDKPLFPRKLKNFHGCPLWLATHSIEPYMMIDSNRGPHSTRGIEGNLFRELGKLLNFRPRIRVGRADNSNKNFDLLRKGRVNLTMFAIVNTVAISEKFTASYPHAYAAVVFTKPRGPPFSPFEKLRLPFEPMVWLFILFMTVSVFSLAAYGIFSKKWKRFVFGTKNQMPFLNFINVAFGGVVTQPPVRNFARTIFLIWLLSSLILRSSYTGALFNIIKSQKSAVEIDTFEKLLDFNFTIYSTVQIARLLEYGSPQLKGLIKRYNGSFDILEETKSHSFHGSFITTTDIIGYHNMISRENGTIEPSRQRLVLLPLSIFMEKHSCLETIINQHIELFSSSGLIEKWSNVYREKLIIARKRPRQPPKKLNLLEVSGAYQLCTYLYGVSTMLFIVEVISVKARYLRKLFDHV